MRSLFNKLNTIFLILIALLCVAPLLHIFAISWSSESAIMTGNVTFWPVKFTLASYNYLLSNKLFWLTMTNSILRTTIGPFISIIICILAAYPLSKSKTVFPMRFIYVWFIFFTMLFNGGIVPLYLVVSGLNITNTIWALILPCAVPAFNVLILLNFFRQLPNELEDAAFIDGCGYYRTLFSVILPMALPAIATIVIFTVIFHWNSWFDGIIFMNTPLKYPLMSYLQGIAELAIDYTKLSLEEIQRLSGINGRSYRAAQVFVGALPVLMIYPFCQKYFISGLVLGSVKG